MNEKDIIREVMKIQGYSQSDLAHLLGMKNQSSVSERLRGSSMRVDTFFKFLDAMGFEVVVRGQDHQGQEHIWKVTGDKAGVTHSE